MAGIIDSVRNPAVRQVPTAPIKPLAPAAPIAPPTAASAPVTGGAGEAITSTLPPAINVAAPSTATATTIVTPDATRTDTAPPAAPTVPTTTLGEPRPETSPEPGLVEGASSNSAWTPSEGLSGNIEEGQTQNVTSTSYTPATAPGPQTYEATGYTPEGYTADQVDENLSQAVDRVISKGGPLAERARAAGLIAAHDRGLGNSSIAIESSYAALLDRALQIAQGDVDVSKFNVGQNNDALRFTADAKNAANAFLANAKNMAAQFNSGEANKMAMFAVEQANLAARYAAEAENAAKMFNADAFNQAKQKYADAVNAARAAEQDARNLARRDAATFAHQKSLQDSQNATQLAAAGIGANASMYSANLNYQANMAQLEQQGIQFDQTMAFNIDQMGQQAFSQYVQGFNALQLAELEPEDRDAAIANYNAIWTGNSYLPITITQPTTPPPSGT